MFFLCSTLAMTKIASRGATHNATSRRFALPEREADGDWLDAQSLVDGAPPALRTSVTVLTPRTILTRNGSPDVPFSQSINAYAGCEHGCIYCFARPTHAYHDLSPGWISRAGCLPSPMPPHCFAPSWPSPATASHRSRLGPTPILISRSRGSGGSHGPSWRCLRRRSSGGDHDQIRSGGTRHRYPGSDGGQGTGDRLRLGHIARRKVARTIEPRAPTPSGGWPQWRSWRPPESPPMSRSRPSFPRSPTMRSNIWSPCGTGGCPPCLFHSRTPAARGRPAVPRLAGHALSRAGGKGDGDHPSLRGGRDNDPDFFTRMKGQGPGRSCCASAFTGPVGCTD